LKDWKTYTFKPYFTGQSIASGDNDITSYDNKGAIYRTTGDIVDWKFVYNISHIIAASVYGNNRFVFASDKFTTVYSLVDNSFKHCEFDIPYSGPIHLGYHSKTKKYYMSIAGTMSSSDDGCKWAMKYLPANTDVYLADAGEKMIAAGGRGITYFSDGD